MKLFSIRYRIKEQEQDFLSDRLRKRLQEEVKYIITSNEYLEAFCVVKDEKKDVCYIHESSLRELSSRELGYDLSKILGCKSLSFNYEEYDDFRFFDLLELIIIFAKKSKRKELLKRLTIIVEEEGGDFYFHDFMLTKRDSSNLRAVVPLLKDELLKNKLEEFYGSFYNTNKPDYEVLARISADMLQRIFSSSKKGKTKNYSEIICEKVARKWATSKAQDLKKLLSGTVKIAKGYNNEISNIRHTDQHTIAVRNPSLYRFITYQNILLVELVVLTSMSDYLLQEDAETIKHKYFKKYSINNSCWVIQKSEKISVEDLPF